jgi:hypothetical protein
VRTIVPPSVRNRASSSHNWRRDCGVEPGGRLVEKEQVRLARERSTATGQPLLLTAGELPHPAPALRLELDDAQELVDRAAAMVERSKEPQRFFNRQLLRQLCLLQLDPEAVGAARVRDRATASRESARRPASGLEQPFEDLDRRGLPAPFGPSSPKHSPRSTENERPSTATTSPYVFTSRSHCTATIDGIVHDCAGPCILNVVF